MPIFIIFPVDSVNPSIFFERISPLCAGVCRGRPQPLHSSSPATVRLPGRCAGCAGCAGVSFFIILRIYRKKNGPLGPENFPASPQLETTCSTEFERGSGGDPKLPLAEDGDTEVLHGRVLYVVLQGDYLGIPEPLAGHSDVPCLPVDLHCPRPPQVVHRAL